MKILFIGDDWVGSNARSMADGFRQAGHEVIVVDTTPVTLPTRLSPAWVYSKAMRRRAPWLQITPVTLRGVANATGTGNAIEFNAPNGLAVDSWMCAISGRAKQFGMIQYFKDCK